MNLPLNVGPVRSRSSVCVDLNTTVFKLGSALKPIPSMENFKPPAREAALSFA